MDADRGHVRHRVPEWLSRLMLGSAGAGALLVVLVGGISLLAQRTADAVTPMEHYSVVKHAVAMLAVAGLTVAVAAGLLRLGQQLLAGVVLVGSVVGPMTVVAAPVRASMAEPSLGDSRLWWHFVVAAAVVSVLTGWTWWVNRCLGERPGRRLRPERPGVVRQVAEASLFGAVAVLSIQAYSMVPAQSNEPAMRAVVGWGLLAAGMVVVTAFARTAWPALALLVAVAATLGLVVLAYSRSGGWPGVAGWELNGMQSPIITSVASTGTVLAAPLLGALCWAVRVAMRGVRRQLSASAAEAAAG